MLLFSDFLSAQEPSYINYTTKDGLLSNEIYDILEDKDGFLWLGTNKGVNRFDSYKMDAYTVVDGLGDNDILMVEQDKRGRVWFLSYNGQLSYWKDNVIYNSKNDPILKSLISKRPYISYLESSNGDLWFGTYSDGVFKLDTSETSIHLPELGFYNGFNKYASFHLFQNDTNIYSIIGGGLISKIGNQPSRIHSELHSITPARIFCYDDQKNILFSSIKNEVSAISFPNLSINWELSLPEVRKSNGMELLSDGLLYVATDNGVFSINNQGNLVHHYLSGKQASDMIIDREGNLWISTLYSGLFCIREKELVNYPTKAKFSIIQHGDSILFGGLDSELHYIKKTRCAFREY